jgi:hypothetical protein
MRMRFNWFGLLRPSLGLWPGSDSWLRRFSLCLFSHMHTCAAIAVYVCMYVCMSEECASGFVSKYVQAHVCLLTDGAPLIHHMTTDKPRRPRKNWEVCMQKQKARRVPGRGTCTLLQTYPRSRFAWGQGCR